MSEDGRISKDSSRNLACDTCRTRKVRCDKASPCSACVASGFPCQSTPRPKARRKKGSGPQAHVRSVPNIEERGPNTIGALASLLAPSVQKRTTLSPLASVDTRLGQVNGTEADVTLPISDTAALAEDNNAFEGESSLGAHSKAARELLEQSIGATMPNSANPELSAALSSLKQLESQKKSQGTNGESKKSRRLGDLQQLYRLPLPPTETVIDLLRQASEQPTITFTFAMSLVPLAQMKRLCQLVFFNVDNYSTSTAILVYATLYTLFVEFTWHSKDDKVKEQYKHYTALCRRNLEFGLLNLDLVLPATMENIQALTIGATFAIETSRTSLCKKLISSAITLLQSLGWHRYDTIRNDEEEERHLKLVIFWCLYIMDKSLSLRLGQASVIQDYDVDLPFPQYNENEPFGKQSTKMFERWTKQARVCSFIYEHLYSPAALKQDDSRRISTAQSLYDECKAIRTSLDKDTQEFRRGLPEADGIPKEFGTEGVIDLIARSDEVSHYNMLTLIHRATPRSPNQSYDPQTRCLDAARSALDCHLTCAKIYKYQDPEAWSMYLHWTVLMAPFIPFTVTFCNTLTSYERSDLARLEQFVESLAESDYSEGAKNMHRLTSIFYRIAKLYVEAKEQENSYQTEQPILGPNSWAPVDSFLNTLGLSGDSLAWTEHMSADLDNWFSGNQYMIGLLDQNLSYLDVMQDTPPTMNGI